MEYHGYWFWSLMDNKIIQSQNLIDEYSMLNCPQQYEGPFYCKDHAIAYKNKFPKLSENFIKAVKEMEEFYI